MLTSLLYVYTSYILYNQQYYLGFILYILCTILSFLWSLKMINNSNHIICKIDVFVAKLCIMYNIYNYINLNYDIKLQKINTIYLALFAVLFYQYKETYIETNTNVSYCGRIIWRLLSFYVTVILYT